MDTPEDLLAGIDDGSISGKLFEPLAPAEIDAMVEAAAADVGVPFEIDALARILATKTENGATYQRLRSRLKKAGVLVSELDKVLAKEERKAEASPPYNTAEAAAQGQSDAIIFVEVTPSAEQVDGEELIGAIIAEIRRYLMLPFESALAVALWIVHAHCFAAFTHSPRLVITSPEKRCGKTTLLRIIEAMVPKALAAANITAAAMFRTIEKYRPTLLIDEVDTFLADNEELRGVLNSGHERRGSVIRLVGDDHEPRRFSTFCPTALAAIGNVPGTIADRAVAIVMRRRLRSETVERLRFDQADQLQELAGRAARWVADHEFGLSAADPVMPEALHDRACDNWRGLLALADLAGGDWPRLAREAALFLGSEGDDADDQSRGVMLLADIRRVFDARVAANAKGWDRVSSTELANSLHALEARPWATWSGGRPISSSAVAKLLKPFGIYPNTLKVAGGGQPNGYKRKQFDDAFERYLPQIAVRGEEFPNLPKPSKSASFRHVSNFPSGSEWGSSKEGASC